MEPILIVASIILAAGGAVSYLIAWNRSGDEFDKRKFANGLVTGIIAGVALAIANATNIVQSLDDTAKFVLIGSLFLSVIGVDQIRGAGSQAVANRAKEESQEQPTQ